MLLLEDFHLHSIQGIPCEILLESFDSVRGRAGLHLRLDHGPQPLHGHGSDRLYR